VGHDDAARQRVRDVDVVVADGDVRDDFQLGSCVDERAIDRIGEQADEGVLVSDARAQLGGRDCGIPRVEVDGRRRFELRDDVVGESAGY